MIYSFIAYLTEANSMRLVDIAKRPFAYSLDSFISCSNPRRDTASDITITIEASSTLCPLSIIHHSPLDFTSPSMLQSYSVSNHIAHTFHHTFPLKTLFDSFRLNYYPFRFTPFSLAWRNESNLHHRLIASFFSKSTLPQYTTLSHLLHHLNFF